MRVVSDTSPLSNLAIIGHLGLLQAQFGQVVIPPAVREELRRLIHPAAQTALETAFRAGWLIVEPVPDRHLVSLLTRELDAGEAEAIALASQTHASLLLVDETEGRSAALRLGLPIVGALGVLLRARLEGALPSLGTEIERLRREAHFFIAPALAARLLVAASE